MFCPLLSLNGSLMLHTIMNSQNVSSPPRKEVRPREAAEMIGSSVGYVYALMAEGQLVHRSVVRRGRERGMRWITIASIEKFLAQGTGVSE